MGLFGKSNEETRRKFGTTIVAEGTELDGELKLPAKLHVDGVIRGSVHSDSDVTVGLSGHVEGEVVAHRVVVSGKLTGNVRCDLIEVAASGSVVGDVVSREFVVEKGAHFEGKNRLPDDNRDPVAERILKPVPTTDTSSGSPSETVRKLGIDQGRPTS